VRLLYSYHDSLGIAGGTIDPDIAYGVARPTPNDPRGPRPWVGMCMVASIDGSTVVDGTSRLLSGPADHTVMVALRKHADTVMVGAQTVRGDGYGKPAKAGQRVAVVTQSRALDMSSELFTSGAGYLIEPSADGTLDLFAAVAAMQGPYVQLEGGPKLNAAMVAANLVDEINLTISPRVTGGDSPRLTTGAPDVMHGYELHHVLESDGFVFLRYVRG